MSRSVPVSPLNNLVWSKSLDKPEPRPFVYSISSLGLALEVSGSLLGALIIPGP